MSYNTILATAPLTTQNYHLKMIGTSIGNSLIWDNGTNVGIGNTNTSYTLDVSGTGRFTSTLLVSGAATFSSNASIGGYLTGQGTNPGGLGGSRYVLDWYSGYMRIFSYGANTSTNGGYTFASQRSDGTNSIDVLSIAPTGAATFSSTLTTSDQIRVTGSTANALYLYGASGVKPYITINEYGVRDWKIGAGTTTSGYLSITTSLGGTDGITITNTGMVLIKTATINTTVSSTSALQANSDIVSIGSSAGFFTQNRASTNIFGWYGTTNFYAWNTDVGNIGQIAYNTGVYTPLSDINKKKDFELSTIGLDAVLGLKPTLYRMKTDDESLDKHLGFIAQEVKEFIPQAYEEFGEGENKFIGLNYNSIVAVLTKAVQELSKQNEELSNRLIKLESK